MIYEGNLYTIINFVYILFLLIEDFSNISVTLTNSYYISFYLHGRSF